MSDAELTLDSKYFMGIPSAERVTKVRSGEVATLASKFDLLADIIEENWNELPPPIKDLAKTYAYHEIENGSKSMFQRLRFAWFMYRNMTSRAEVVHLLSSMARLSDAVFAAVERENPVFNLRLDQALDSEVSERPMNAEQFRVWTKGL